MTNAELIRSLIKFIGEDLEKDKVIKETLLVLMGEAEPKATPTKKAAEPKPTRKKKLDHGKLVACYKAGWPIAKIADELGCTSVAVRQHLHKEGLLA